MVHRVILFHLPPAGGDFFPISLGYLAASLKSAGVDVIIEDLTLEKPKSLAQLQYLITNFRPGIIGFSAYQWNMQGILSLASFCKKIDPSIRVVMGGPQATFMPKQALLQMSAVDIVCRGEGEVVLRDLCRCLSQKKSLDKVAGIVFRQKGKLVETAPRPLLPDLDELPSPYQSGIFDFKQHQIATLLASRGCTFNCSFCYTPKAFQRQIRWHSPRRVLKDMEVCYNKGLRNFFFCDPSFTFYKENIHRIMGQIQARRWKIDIWCTTRSDLVDRFLLLQMAKAGVKTIAYGLEAADPQVLKAVNKKLNLKKFKEVVLLTKQLGIQVEVYSMFNLPAQNYNSALKTLELLKELDIRISGNSFGQQMCLYFGAAVCDYPDKFGIKVDPDSNRPDFLSCGFNYSTQEMSKSERQDIIGRYASQSLLHAIEQKGRRISRYAVQNNYCGRLPYEILRALF